MRHQRIKGRVIERISVNNVVGLFLIVHAQVEQVKVITISRSQRTSCKFGSQHYNTSESRNRFLGMAHQATVRDTLCLVGEKESKKHHLISKSGEIKSIL